MSRIFISHAVADKVLVKAFLDLLQTGMQVRYTDIYCTSKGDIDVGSQYIDNMKDNLRNCEVVVMLLSVNYFKSSFCLAEMGGAWALNKTLVPFLIPPKQFKDVEQPSTPLKATQIFKIQDRQNITQLFQKLVNLRIVEHYDLNRFNEKVEEFIKKRPWVNSNNPFLSSLSNVGLNSNFQNKKQPVIGSLENVLKNENAVTKPLLSKSPLSASSNVLKPNNFGIPTLPKK
jgi:hypothetical protein